MTEFEFFESSLNVSNKLITRVKSTSGKIAWKIPPNKTGKCVIKFPNVYATTPRLLVTTAVENGNPVEIKTGLGQFTLSSFELHICSTDMMNEISGVSYYFVEEQLN